MTVLPKGGNAPLTATHTRAVLTWDGGVGPSDIDLCGLLVTTDGCVRDDADFVFYNQPRHNSGAVVHSPTDGLADVVEVNLNDLPAEIDKVVLAASIGAGNFGAVAGLKLSVQDVTGTAEAIGFEDMGASTETAFVVGEYYKRNGAWKFRAIGQGWDTGLAGLATNYGVSIESEPTIPASEPLTAAPELSPSAAEPPVPAAKAPAAPPVAAAVAAEAPSPAAPAYVDGPVPASRAVSAQAVEVTQAVERPSLPHVPTLDSTPAELTRGAYVALTQGGTPLSGVLRVRFPVEAPAEARGAIAVDSSAIALDNAGVPVGVVFFDERNAVGSALRQGGGQDPALVDVPSLEINLDQLRDDVAAIVIALASYEGQPISALGPLGLVIANASGAELVKAPLTATDGSAVLVASLVRAADGRWLVKGLDDTATGRTGRSLVGSAHWSVRG